ncbi:hypothetical protein WJX82_007443 [Trebouxia sp. C0006]
MSSRDSSPMLQALTLSTNLSKTEKPRTKMPVGGTLQDADQSFRAKTLQTIKASHQSRSSTGSQIARTGNVGSIRTNSATPPGIAASGRLRDAAARSDSRILQDAGLRVSAVKVSLHQPLDPNQGTSVHSPYLTKGPDGKGMMKRKGLVRSATFTAGSADTLDSISIDADIIGRLGSRGARPSASPAASNIQHAASMDTSKQSSKRRQVAETADPPIFSLPHFRAKHEAALSRSSSDSSSIAASLEEDSYRQQVSKPLQTIVRVRTSGAQRKQPVKSPLDSAAESDAVSTSHSTEFGGYAVSSQVLSQALKSLGHKNARHASQSEVVPQQVGAIGHMNGNSVVSCVSASDASQSARSASQSLDLQIDHSKDPLVKESHQVMHWLGMNDAWFVEDFLPFAKRTVLGHHQE